MIHRQSLVTRHNLVLTQIHRDSPLSIGNGEFVFTADITGLQTLYHEYEETFPLCTMANFGWHVKTDQGRVYTLKDLPMTEYHSQGRTFFYPVKKTPENARVYDWLRENPHKVNLFRLGFVLDGREIKPEQLTQISQELDLYRGVLTSAFCVEGKQVKVQTVCSSQVNEIACHIKMEEGLEKRLGLALEFPYGSPAISGSDWESPEKHESLLTSLGKNHWLIHRTMDDLEYQAAVDLENGTLVQREKHRFEVICSGESLRIGVMVVPGTESSSIKFPMKTFRDCAHEAETFWKTFWETTGLMDFSRVKDNRAKELERREILSLYLLRLQCAGSLPPAETGLTCNSWYGKFHLEMHFWHSGFWPLYSQGKLLENSLPWYRAHVQEARENSRRNGYKGARWPKMTGPEGVDSPSKIAPLLIWQQPHLIFMLELLYRCSPEKRILEEYFDLVWETAEFMVDFAQWNPETKAYDLNPPLIPVQEKHDPMVTKNPAFELVYWKETLEIAAAWAGRLNREYPEEWKQVGEKMAAPAAEGGVYLAHANAPDTFTHYAKDHPSMLMAYGLLKGEELDRETVKRTLEKVLETWDFSTAWGWDFAVMAMTAAKLGDKELAVDLLLKPAQKNEYVLNGHNRQGYRKDLPLYLPGNGSFLYGLAVIGGEGEESSGGNHGFPEGWEVEMEGIQKGYC